MEQEYQVDMDGNQVLDEDGSPIPVDTSAEEEEEPTVDIDGEKVSLSEIKKSRDREKDYDQRKTALEAREKRASESKPEKVNYGFQRKTDEELGTLMYEDPTAYQKYLRQEREAERQEGAMASGIRRVNDDINSLAEKNPEIGKVGNKNIVDRKNPIWKILESNPGLFQTDDPVGFAYAKLFSGGITEHDKKVAEATRKEIEERKKVIGTTEYIVGDKAKGGEKTITLSPEEKRVADRTGLTYEEYAASKAKTVIEE